MLVDKLLLSCSEESIEELQPLAIDNGQHTVEPEAPSFKKR
jgi:hypothetical protein